MPPSLLSRQTTLHARILARAIEFEFDVRRICPVYDGVVDDIPPADWVDSVLSAICNA